MEKHTNDRWADLSQIRGLRVFASQDDLANAKRESVVSRKPDNCLYLPAGETPLYDEEEYGRLNDELHEKMTATARKHFKGTRIGDDYPKGGVRVDFLKRIGTAFTYQNGDWYGPTYECYIGVLAAYISGKLLLALQRLLKGDFANWCIVVGLCQDSSFGDGAEILVFSDRALLHHDAARQLRLPDKFCVPSRLKAALRVIWPPHQ